MQIFSTSHTTDHAEESQRTQGALRCRRLCIRLLIAVDISLLLQLDPKSAEVEKNFTLPQHRQAPNICKEPFNKAKDQVLLLLLDGV